MIRTCVRAGWRAAMENRRLIVTLWAWSAVAALVAGVGAWRWLSSAFNHAPEADRLLERFHFGLAVELMQYDRFTPVTTLRGALTGLLIAAVISNPLVAGGVLEVIVSRDGRPLLHRFFRGAGHFFGRFLRLLIVTAIAALILLIAAGALTRPIVGALGESSWERAWAAAAVARFVLLASLVGLTAIVLDLARARVVLAPVEVRGMLRQWLSAARFVLRHFVSVVGTYLAFGVLLSVAIGIYLALTAAFPAVSWPGILMLIVLQQAFAATRAALRVASAAAGVELIQSHPDRVPSPLASEPPSAIEEAAHPDLTPA